MTPLTVEEVEALIADALAREDDRDLLVLEGIYAKMDSPVQKVASMGGAALWYAEQGLKVFPLKPKSKVPLGGKGCLDATNDLAVVRMFWEWHPDSNIGIATGHLVDVVDIDGPIGVESWMKLAMPPVLGQVRTPRAAGHHLYVRASGEGNKAGIHPGVDYRGVGGYVVAPPSLSAEGVPYYWVLPLGLNPKGTT